jgi:hypothetical protein
MLKLIKGTKKPRHTLTDEKKAQCYLRMFQSSMTEYYKTQSRWALTKAAYNGVRMINIHYRIMSNAEFVPVDMWKMMFQTYKSTGILISLMTQEEIIRTFPITKTYYGKRCECADYFSSLSLFDGLKKDMSLMIQFKEPYDVLFGYQNPHICHLLVGMTCTVDRLRKEEGKDDLFTGFCKEQGIEPPETIRVYKDDKGRKYAVDSNGKAMPLRKAKPRYLKVLK